MDGSKECQSSSETLLTIVLFTQRSTINPRTANGPMLSQDASTPRALTPKARVRRTVWLMVLYSVSHTCINMRQCARTEGAHYCLIAAWYALRAPWSRCYLRPQIGSNRLCLVLPRSIRQAPLLAGRSGVSQLGINYVIW